MDSQERAELMRAHSEWTYSEVLYGEFWQLPVSVKRAIYDAMPKAVPLSPPGTLHVLNTLNEEQMKQFTQGPLTASLSRVWAYGGECVAQCFEMAGKPNEAACNSMLYAAAPDLYKAVKKALARGCSCMSNTEDDWHAADCPTPMLRAAISKAGGAA